MLFRAVVRFAGRSIPDEYVGAVRRGRLQIAPLVHDGAREILLRAARPMSGSPSRLAKTEQYGSEAGRTHTLAERPRRGADSGSAGGVLRPLLARDVGVVGIYAGIEHEVRYLKPVAPTARRR